MPGLISFFMGSIGDIIMTKQSIVRRRSYGDTTTSGTAAKTILFTADENMTLRRLIVRLVYVKDGTNVSETAMFGQIFVEPNGNQTVDDVQTLGINNQEMDYNYIGGFVVPNMSGGGSSVEFDSKGMRKLRKGDRISMQFVTSVSSGATGGNYTAYYADLFFGQN